jgi:putative membrane protein
MKTLLSLHALSAFVLYFGTGMVLLLAFARLYIWMTPYNEFDEIRAGHRAPAMALFGAMLGYTFPLMAVSLAGVSYGDYLVWALVAMAVQLAVFKFFYAAWPHVIEHDNRAAAIAYAGLATCTGLINAVSMIP